MNAAGNPRWVGISPIIEKTPHTEIHRSLKITAHPDVSIRLAISNDTEQPRLAAALMPRTLFAIPVVTRRQPWMPWACRSASRASSSRPSAWSTAALFAQAGV